MAINLFNNTEVSLDNKVTLSNVYGTLDYMLSDDELQKIKSIIDAMVSQRGGSGIVSSSQTGYKATSTPVATGASTEKKPYVATKDFTPKYEIKELSGTDGTKLFCISRANGWTRAEKSLMNSAIKALKGIKEIDVQYEKDSKTRTFKAWGYGTEATAKKHMKELPTVFTVEQLNSFGK